MVVGGIYAGMGHWTTSPQQMVDEAMEKVDAAYGEMGDWMSGNLETIETAFEEIGDWMNDNLETIDIAFGEMGTWVEGVCVFISFCIAFSKIFRHSGIE